MYQRIKDLCEKRGMSISELEDKAHIGNGVIRAWDTSYPRIDILAVVAKALGVSLSTLVKTIDVDEIEKKREEKRKEKERESNVERTSTL